MKLNDADYLRELQSIAVKMADFCARLSGHEGVPHEVAREAMRLAHEYKSIGEKRRL